MKKNLRIRVFVNCGGHYWWYAICEGKRQLISTYGGDYKSNVIRGAKAMAKRIGIKYDSEIVRPKGC